MRREVRIWLVGGIPLVLAIVAMPTLTGCGARRGQRAYANVPRLRTVLQAQREGVFVFSAPAMNARLTEQERADIQARIARILGAKAIGLDRIKDIALGVDRFTVRTRVQDEADQKAQGSKIRAALSQAFPKIRVLSSTLRQITPTELAETQRIIESRVRDLRRDGVAVQTQSPDRIVVELPDLRGSRQALRALETTGQLEFRFIGHRYEVEYEAGSARAPARAVFTDQAGNEVPESQVVAESPVIVRGNQLRPNAGLERDASDKPIVVFELKRDGAAAFWRFTRNHRGDFIAIVLDGHIISAPKITGAIHRRGAIADLRTDGEALQLAALLNSGALPVPLEQIETRVVKPRR
jgi:protein-export membrane protein SecD